VYDGFMTSTPGDPRPVLVAPLERLLAAIVAGTPELGGLDATSVLLVAQGAHGRAAASVRSLTADAHRVEVGGHVRTIEVALRPPFFQEGDATARLTTLLHELLHIDPSAPGALLDEHRHERRTHAEHEEHARTLAASWLRDADLEIIAPLGHQGEVLMRAWKHRPVPGTDQQHYDDEDIYLAPLLIITPAARRTTWG